MSNESESKIMDTVYSIMEDNLVTALSIKLLDEAENQYINIDVCIEESINENRK
jgi:hypothetical protein